MFICAAFNGNSKRAKIFCNITETSLNPGSLQEQKRSYFVQGNLTQTSSHFLLIWKVMQRNAWSDIASWRTKHSSNFTRLQFHAWMTINSKKKNWDLLENSPKYARKLSWSVCIWHALVDHAFLLSVNKFARTVTKWTRACDKRLVLWFLKYTTRVI